MKNNTKPTKKAAPAKAKSQKQVKTQPVTKVKKPKVSQANKSRIMSGLKDLARFGAKAAEAFKKGDIAATAKSITAAADAALDIEIPLENALA